MKRILMMLAALAVAGCSSGGSSGQLPPEVLGEWTTKSLEYAGRSFLIEPETLTIVVDENTRFVHPIERVEVSERFGRPFITIHHVNRDGIDDTFRIEYAEYPSTFIRLNNVDNVYWIRPEAAAVEL